MPATRFTDRWLRSLRAAPGARQEYAGTTCPGLRVRVGARGVQFSALVRTPDGRRRRVPLGTFPETSLAEARRALGEIDPAALAEPVEEGATALAGARAGTVADMIALALDHYAARGSREVETMRTYLERGALAAVHTLGADTPAAAVTPDDVTRWLRRVHAANVKTHHPRNHLSRAWLCQMSRACRTADVARRHYDRPTYAAAKVEVAREIDALVEEVERVAADRSDDALPGDRAVA